MSDRIHYKGRFIKQKVLNKRLKAVTTMAEPKKRQKKSSKVNPLFRLNTYVVANLFLV